MRLGGFEKKVRKLIMALLSAAERLFFICSIVVISLMRSTTIIIESDNEGNYNSTVLKNQGRSNIFHRMSPEDILAERNHGINMKKVLELRL